MISGSKGQKAVRACTIGLLNLGPAKHEEAAIYAVNQRIPNVLELRELFYSGAIRGYQMRGKIPFDLHIIVYVYRKIYYNLCSTVKYYFLALSSAVSMAFMRTREVYLASAE